MARGNPKVRLTVSLDSDLVDLLKTLSELSGKSVSAFLNDVLRESSPQLQAFYEVLTVVKNDPARASQILLKASDDAVAKMDKITNKIKEKTKPKSVKRAG